MSTLTIELSDELAARLAAACERQHVAPGQMVEQVLAKALPQREPQRKVAFDPVAHLAWLHKTWGDRMFSPAEVAEMRDFEDGAAAP